MQRLNIPLRTGNSTTRPSRRVVWSIVWVIGAGFAFFVIVQLFLGRTTLSSGAPEGLAAFDVVGRKALAELSANLGDVPLLSSKPVTLNSLLPHIHREVFFEILPDFSRIIAFHGRLTDEEQKKLEDFGVWVSQVDGVTILSDASQDLSAWKVGLGLHASAVLPGFAGLAKLEGKRHNMTVGADGVSLWKYRSLLPHAGAPALPPSTVAWIPFDGQSDDFPPYLSALFSLGLDQPMQSLLAGNSGALLLTVDNDGWGYRLSLYKGVESQKLAQVLQSSVALMNPTTQTRTLADSTVVDEMVVDTSQVKMSIEETTSGVLVRAEGGSVQLIARKSGDVTVITNRSDLLDVKTAGKGTIILMPNAISMVTPSTAANQQLEFWSLFKKVLILQGKYTFSW